jgi:hypothetical protein
LGNVFLTYEKNILLGVMAHTCNLSTWEAEAGGTQVQGQPGHQWFMPVIPATQEAEIRRISVRSQPRENSSRDPVSKKPFTKK